ncbi:MAG: aminoacyl-tRNA hydrolase [Candidatus Omnitrophota bacterium]
MKIIVGLGNPGPEYKATKHNIGFEVVTALAKSNKIRINKTVHFSLLGKGKIAGEDVILALPQTYMNLSGKAVGELFGGAGAGGVADLLVVCDDINIELGRVRLKKEGSSGGHKGLESIIHTLGKNDFARLRVGIATDVHKGDITGYVLAPFKRKEKRNVAHVITLAGDAVTCMIEEGIDKAMTRFNKKKIGTS